MGGYHLPYYTKENLFTKDMLFKIFLNDADLLRYIPNNPNLRAIPRDFLLSVLANIRREKYAQLYSKYKEMKTERSTGSNKIYKAIITNEFLTGLKFSHQ